MKIFLCGFSGAGKTSLACKFKNNSLGYEVFDLDELISDELGINPGNLGCWIEQNGLEEFRKKEQFHFERLMARRASFVVALGGGALNDKSLRHIQSDSDARLVFLDTPFEVCFERIRHDANRALSRLSKQQLLETYQSRLLLYQKAHKTLREKDIKEIDGLERLVHNLS